jgi:glycosyltransferase involved in cell wall biosynthesis
MRILHIISNMKPEAGGPQEAVRMMLRSAPDDYISEVVTLDNAHADLFRTEPFTIHTLGSSAKLAPWLRTNRDRFDGVILHGMWESLSYTVLRTIAGHKPYMVFAHGMLDPYFKRAFPLKHFKKWLYWLPVQYWVMRRALRVVFTTATERDLAAKSFWLHRWTPLVVGLGAETPPQNLATCTATFIDLCPAVQGQRFLLFLGRIDPKKGCDLLINAFIAMRDTDPALHLVMAGPDSSNWRTELQTFAERSGVAERIHWTGMLRGDAKWGAFAASEAFILPSHQENFGIAVVEALACGKPVLVTKPINIAPDLAADGCALIEDDTLEGTTQLLTRWLALSDTEKSVMSQHALDTFATRYDMRRNTITLLQAFDTAVAEQPNALAEVHRA